MIVGVGVILTAIGLISLVSSWGAIGAARYFRAAFLGLPLIALGSGLAQARKLGAYSRDLSRHMVPVARNNVNTLDQQEHRCAACERCHAPTL